VQTSTVLLLNLMIDNVAPQIPHTVMMIQPSWRWSKVMNLPHSLVSLESGTPRCGM